MAANPAGGGAQSRPVANFPGFNYLARIASAANNAMDAHAELLNDAWSQMREGTYTPQQALKTWSRVTDNYVGVVTDMWRVSNADAPPSWLLIPYYKANPVLPHSVPIDQVLAKNINLDITSFVGLGKGSSIPAADLLAVMPHATGTRIEFELKQSKADGLTLGDGYLAFVFQKGAGAAAPLVAIVLQKMD